VRTCSSLRSDHYLPGLGAATNWIPVIVYRSNMLEGVRLGSHDIVEHHRSGWAFALEQLRNLHALDGITFDDFVEKKFSRAGRASAEYALPYTEPWVGIVHNPPGVPHWFNANEQAPQFILRDERWLRSMPYCRGLFTLSTYCVTGWHDVYRCQSRVSYTPQGHWT
jgi:hypothetical protein